MPNLTEDELKILALAIGRVITRGQVEPKGGWLEAAKAAVAAMPLRLFKDTESNG